ncbi:hypothetical protein [Bifidobacterium pseudocatenulatum]|jgi:hypothetical protein|uniref:hypothetical protein n=1 Tax=Bifidobacterium pseudocatenulatum TaxID=28026 RepID=UPI00080BB34D|nr:hypothetical protein [Bifidobacterium pseudocatenulatum]MCB4877028.1 hypothetical protein [Bifidobacterium pseudocatenulatum]
MSVSEYCNGNTNTLQAIDNESDNKLTIIQSTAFGKELMFTTVGDGTASSVIVNNAEDLRKIRDYMDESLRWMED